jgi:hypothetical protein
VVIRVNWLFNPKKKQNKKDNSSLQEKKSSTKNSAYNQIFFSLTRGAHSLDQKMFNAINNNNNDSGSSGDDNNDLMGHIRRVFSYPESTPTFVPRIHIPSQTEIPYPEDCSTKQLVEWLVIAVGVFPTRSSLKGRIIAPKRLEEVLVMRIGILLDEKVWSTKAPSKDPFVIKIELSPRAVESLEKVAEELDVDIEDSRFWRSLCKARADLSIKTRTIQERTERLLRMASKNPDGIPRCSKCNTTEGLVMQRRDRGPYISALLQARKRWAEAEEAAKTAIVLCRICHPSGSRGKRRKLEDSTDEN